MADADDVLVTSASRLWLDRELHGKAATAIFLTFGRHDAGRTRLPAPSQRQDPIQSLPLDRERCCRGGGGRTTALDRQLECLCGRAAHGRE
jgi:hypothetical protein